MPDASHSTSNTLSKQGRANIRAYVSLAFTSSKAVCDLRVHIKYMRFSTSVIGAVTVLKFWLKR